MKSQMKSIIAALSLAFPLALTAAGPSAEEMAFYKAYKNGAQAKECLRVVDQDGMPVVGANEVLRMGCHDKLRFELHRCESRFASA